MTGLQLLDLERRELGADQFIVLSVRWLYVQQMQSEHGCEDGAQRGRAEVGSTESRMSEAVKITTSKAAGKSREEVESILRAEMEALEVQPADTVSLAEDIVKAVASSS